MFTGLIEEIGEITGSVNSGSGIILTINAVKALEGMKIGDSISINGACQTVTALTNRSFSVFASSVTASVTTLGSYRTGKRVNLERAMTPASRFGGHFVQGHVDGTGSVEMIRRDSAGMSAGISVGDGLKKYIIEKGSVAVDGISLTVVSVTPNGFTLYFIPGSLFHTTASAWQAGDEVNIEVDILAKYVERMISSMKGGGNGKPDDGMLLKKLIDEGFF
jgi:riboflavin synthase